MDAWTVSDALDIDVDGVAQVEVRVVAGEVTVTPGSGTHVDVTRESGADVVVELSNGVLRISQPDANAAPLERLLKLFTEGRRHRCTVNLTLPSHVKIDVTTVSGTVLASGIDGGTRVKTVSGDVTLARLGGDVNVKTVSGDVAAKDLRGELRLKTVSGDLAVVDGSCGHVDAKSVSGDVLLDLELDPNGTYDASTVSGDVSLRTTAEPSLEIDAKTVSGSFISDFGGRSSERPGHRTVRHTIGNGGARLWVKTVSGNLRIVRGREAAA